MSSLLDSQVAPDSSEQTIGDPIAIAAKCIPLPAAAATSEVAQFEGTNLTLTHLSTPAQSERVFSASPAARCNIHPDTKTHGHDEGSVTRDVSAEAAVKGSSLNDAVVENDIATKNLLVLQDKLQKMRSKFVRAHQVLKELDHPSLPDKRVPEFSISNALVFRNNEFNAVDLLLVGAEGAASITGILEPLRPRQLVYLKNARKPYSGLIRLDEVTEFEFSEDRGGEGGVKIWATTKFGYFLLRTVDEQYASVYASMAVSVKIIRFMQLKTSWKEPADVLFRKYAENTRDLAPRDVEAALRDKRLFFIEQMLRKPGEWKYTLVRRYMESTFPADFERVEKAKWQEYLLDVPASGWQEKDVLIWGFFTAIQKKKKLVEDFRINLDSLALALTVYYNIDDPAEAKLLILACADKLVQYMSATTSAQYDWTKRAIHNQLQKSTKPDAEICQRVLLFPLEKRKRPVSFGGGSATPAAEDEVLQENDTDSDSINSGRSKRVVNRTTRAAKGKSALRPSAITATIDDDEGTRVSSGSSSEVDTSAAGSHKRKAGSGLQSPKTARRKLFQPSADSDSSPLDPTSESKPGLKVKFMVKKVEMPSFQPQGPGGVWSCFEDGCNYKVYNAGSISGLADTTKHLSTHPRYENILRIVYSETTSDKPTDFLREKLLSGGTRTGEAQIALKSVEPVGSNETDAAGEDGKITKVGSGENDLDNGGKLDMNV